MIEAVTSIEVKELLAETKKLIENKLIEVYNTMETGILAECRAKNIPIEKILHRCSLHYYKDNENDFGYRVHLHIDNKFIKDITP